MRVATNPPRKAPMNNTYANNTAHTGRIYNARRHTGGPRLCFAINIMMMGKQNNYI